MIRTTGFFGYSRLLSAGLIGAVILATGLSCSDGTTAPSSLVGDLESGALASKVFYHSSAEKSAAASAIVAAADAVAPSSVQTISGNHVASIVAAVSAPVPMYSVFPVAFAPETPAVMTALSRGDDEVTGVSIAGIGNPPWLFSFYGNNYNIVYISSNGFIGFRNTIGDGYKGGSIPNSADAPYNNLAALAWTDLDPSAAGASYSYGVVGTAPHRKFVVQWTNVPEYDLAPNASLQKTPGSPLGHLTGQIVLSEGSNDITMYTTSLDISSSFHPVTQGIENFGGDEAAFLPGRVQAHYATALVNDGVRFSLSHGNQPPVVVAPPNINVNTDAGLCSAALNPGTPTVNDDASGWSVVGVRSDALQLTATYPARVTSITWTATDAGGLTGAAAQAVTVKDAEAPTINVPEAVVATVDPHSQTASLTLTGPAASDNCAGVNVAGSRSDSQPMNTGFPVGVTTVKWVATDAAGNSASVTQTVTVSGNQAPTISAPDISANTDASVCTAAVNPTPVVSDDADGTTFEGVRSDGANVKDPYPKGVTTIDWKATDAGHLTATARQKITVSDKEKPSIVAPPNTSAGNSGRFGIAAVSVGNPTAGDNCKIVTVEGKRSDGAALSAPFPIGTTVITWSATDASLNSNSATQSVTVMDLAAPTFDALPAMTVDATMPSGAVVQFTATATDNVGVKNIVCSPESGSTFPIGKSTVGCTASDDAGNRTTASFDVTVLGAHEQIAELIAKVTAMNMSPGDANPLLNSLETAYSDPGNGSSHVACIKLSDFISHFQGVRGHFVMQKSQASLVDDAQRIRTVMGC